MKKKMYSYEGFIMGSSETKGVGIKNPKTSNPNLLFRNILKFFLNAPELLKKEVYF